MAKDEIFISPIDLNIELGKVEIPYVPTVRVATPVFNSENKKIGIIILNVYFDKFLKLLPKDAFIQTKEDNLVYFKPDGSIEFDKSTYGMSGTEGEIAISKYNYIHYREAEYLAGNTFFIGIHHNHRLLHTIINRIILLASSFFFIFLLMILFVTYLYIRKFNNLIEAHRAIIFALATLAEWRDRGVPPASVCG